MWLEPVPSNLEVLCRVIFFCSLFELTSFGTLVCGGIIPKPTFFFEQERDGSWENIGWTSPSCQLESGKAQATFDGTTTMHLAVILAKLKFVFGGEVS